MPLPRALARFNRRVTTPLFHRAAGRLPGFAVVEHHGRRSGRAYRTPVNAFRRPGGGYVIALTYGPDSDWARNVLAEGGCTLRVRGRRLRLVGPCLTRDPAPAGVPAPVRAALRALRADLVLELDPPAA